MIKTITTLVLLGLTSTLGAPSNDRIVGGSPAQLGQFPYQISLQINGQHICGGSIISPTKVLTAAHCIYGNNQPMQVVAGILDLGTSGQRKNIYRAVYHSGYNPNTSENDIAVITLDSDLVYDGKVHQIIMSQYAPTGNELLTLSGWGLTSYPGIIPTRMQFIHLYNIDLQTCAAELSGISSPITQGHVCTISPAGEGACQGDSGGPLINQLGRLVGVVSWGIPCAKGRPDVFTSVAHYFRWISNN